MFSHVNYIMVGVSDMKRSVEFYRDKLGLPLGFESDEWTEFKTGTTKLALHGGSKPKNSSALEGGAIAAGTCSIGFEVEDLDKTCEELKAKGVNFVMPPAEKEAEGLRLAVCTDPDGLGISIAQSTRKW